MSISNILQPNNFHIYAGDFTISNLDINNLNVSGNLAVDGNTSIGNVATIGPGKILLLTDGTVSFNNSNVDLNNASTLSLNLEKLSNVLISSPTNGQSLVYNGTNWINSLAGNSTSGSYIPTFTGIQNITSFSFLKAFYTQIGNIVTTYITLQYNPTAPTVLNIFNFSLPVPRSLSFNVTSDLIGTATQVDTGDSSMSQGYCVAQVGNQLGRYLGSPITSMNSFLVTMCFEYSIIP